MHISFFKTADFMCEVIAMMREVSVGRIPSMFITYENGLTFR